MSELETLVGEPELAARTRRIGAEVAGKADEVFWNEDSADLYADDLTHEHFSEHSQCLALLGGLLLPERQARIAANLLTDTERYGPWRVPRSIFRTICSRRTICSSAQIKFSTAWVCGSTWPRRA